VKKLLPEIQESSIQVSTTLQALIKRHYVLKEIGYFTSTQRKETSGIGILEN